MKEEIGQTLVTLLLFMVIVITITSAVITVSIVNSQSLTRFEQGTEAYYVAESGAENALLRILRNPSYAGETLPVGNGAAVIQVTSGATTTITSTGQIGNFVRKIEVAVSFPSGTMVVNSWKEVY